MAFPSDKFYDKIINPFTAKEEKRDLSEVCESDLASGYNRITGLPYQLLNYKYNGNQISIPNYPKASDAPAMKLVSLNYKDSSQPLKIPYIGTVPSMFDITKSNPGIAYKILEGPEVGGNTITYKVTYNDDEGWLVNGEVVWAKNNFYKGIVPHHVAIILQGAGGGGGGPSSQTGSYATFGGAGGGSGATIWLVCTMGYFHIRLAAPGGQETGGGAAILADPFTTLRYISAGGGGAGGKYTSKGSGGTIDMYELTYEGGRGQLGVSGGQGGLLAPASVAGSDGTGILHPGLYFYNSLNWSYQAKAFDGGVGSSVAGQGGGGAASFFSNGADGATAGNIIPSQPGYGAGGGGAFASINAKGGPGGKSCAVIYFGYSA